MGKRRDRRDISMAWFPSLALQTSASPIFLSALKLPLFINKLHQKLLGYRRSALITLLGR